MERAGSEFSVVDGLSLYNVALRVQNCSGYVGNDSGVTHLAAALGIPTVALFGPSDPAVWGPRNPNARILAAQPATTAGLARIAPECVERVCRKIFGENQRLGGKHNESQDQGLDFPEKQTSPPFWP